jgi:hypothetical protein
VTISTSQPKLSEALANAGLSSGSMTDRRVREQLGGRQNNGHSLNDMKGLVTGLYTNLTGNWYSQPRLDGNMYKGFDTNGSLPDNPNVTFHDHSGSPVYRSVKLMGDSPGGGTLNDRNMEVICCGKVEENGVYRFSFDMRVHRNNFYNNVWWKAVVASSALGYLMGSVNLDSYQEQQIINAPTSFREYTDDCTLTTLRPYVCIIFYALHRSGGSPSHAQEGVEFKNARLTKL